MKHEELPDILTMKQACEVLNCHPNTLRNWDSEGKIEAIRFGSRGDRRFRKSDILNFLKKNQKD
ncbi:TPA: DNA-binding protein [Candidatus Uhrbacteria bacterium]|nr:DNA-binding protein [Candidatus Uhrbacteria bacterium]HCB56184.1 DNA-binding protein [Candidatus Uhrbacteria bacterium]